MRHIILCLLLNLWLSALYPIGFCKAGETTPVFLCGDSANIPVIKGRLPGKENHKLFIGYFPPVLGGSKFIDSCIIDKDGSFEFQSPFQEPVLAVIRLDFLSSFDFIADTGIVKLIPTYAEKDFSILALEAVSPLNKDYMFYKTYIRAELTLADSLYQIRDRLVARKKKDSLHLLEPLLANADSLLFRKNYDFAFRQSCCEFIKSFVIYRRLMLRLPGEELRLLYELLGPNGKNSLYGEAILGFVLSKHGLRIGVLSPLFYSQLSPDGSTVRLEDYRGKYVLVDFWGSWCQPCRAQHPDLIKLYREYKAKGFEIIGIALEKSKEEWLRAIQKDDLPWIQATDLKFWGSECAKLYGLYSLPFNVLLDKEGKIVAMGLEPDALAEKLDLLFNKK
ncbi:MAG: AhpC/TSA family protein [Chitinophagales bacterium]|nr:AhpC/TSA family protein [Chitinophagales bacterium]